MLQYQKCIRTQILPLELKDQRKTFRLLKLRMLEMETYRFATQTSEEG